MSNAGRRLGFAAAISAALSIAVLTFVVLPQDLDVRTDIVGNPTFANFNIYKLYWTYGLTIALFPLVTVGTFLLLTRSATGSFGTWRPRTAPVDDDVEQPPAIVGWRRWTTAVGRAGFVGAVLGFQAAICIAQTSWLVVGAATAYLVLLGAASWIARRALKGVLRSVSTLNALAAPLTLVGLYAVSRSTTITITSSDVTRDYPWLPAWLALGAAAGVGLWVSRSLRRRIEPVLVERWALLWVVGPVVLYLGVALLPGELGTFDTFEEGMVLSGADLTLAGAVPWRDLIVAHGLLFDVGVGFLGRGVFEDSRWGLVAGDQLLVIPLYWLGLYYVCAYLFGRNWLYLAGTQLLILTGYFLHPNTRFLLVPFVLLLLVGALQRPTVARGVAFTSLLALQVLVTPEAVVAAVAFVGTLILFEIYYFDRDAGFRASFRRTWICLTTVAVLTVAWALFLASFGLLDDWVFSLRATIPGHELTGGIFPLRDAVAFDSGAPLALILFVWAYVCIRTWLGRPLSFRDWAMVAMGALTLLYYTKFLGYADVPHMWQAFSVAVPLLFYVAYRGITYGEAALVRLAKSAGWREFPAHHTLTLPLLIVLLALAANPPHVYLRGITGRFSEPVSSEATIPRVGYARVSENDPRALANLNRTLLELSGGPDVPVFDMTNAPGMFHYLLDRPTSTRYTQMILAMRRTVQRDLIGQLEKSRPPVAILLSDSRIQGLPLWDNITNEVRHYDVSEYLLRHYVPVRKVSGYLVMARSDLDVSARPALYFSGFACRWGTVPNFLSTEPDPGASKVDVGFRPVERRSDGARRWNLELPANASDYDWLEIRTGADLQEGTFKIADRTSAPERWRRFIDFKTLERSGSEIRVKVGSCPQWMGYEPRAVYLESDVPQDVRSIRLVR